MPEVSPWIDARFQGPIEPVNELLEAQTHRRFMKSHLAIYRVPFFPGTKYVVIGRDTRDVFMSLWSHYSAYTDLAYELFNDLERPGAEFPRCPSEPRDLWPRWIGERWFDWENDGWPFCSHNHHLSTWWNWRHLPNVHVMHFADMLANTEGEMRELATFCEIDVSEERWPAIVEAVQLDSMRKEVLSGANEDLAAMIFEGGVSRFLFKGTNGRWRDVLTDEDLALYMQSATQLDPGLRSRLEGGRAKDVRHDY